MRFRLSSSCDRLTAFLTILFQAYLFGKYPSFSQFCKCGVRSYSCRIEIASGINPVCLLDKLSKKENNRVKKTFLGNKSEFKRHSRPRNNNFLAFTSDIIGRTSNNDSLISDLHNRGRLSAFLHTKC
jgi:hypothetical protein